MSRLNSDGIKSVAVCGATEIQSRIGGFGDAPAGRLIARANRKWIIMGRKENVLWKVTDFQNY